MIGVAWTTAAALFVNSMFLNGVGRIILFGLMTFVGIGLYAVWERKDTS